MASSPTDTSTASNLLSQTDDILRNIARLNSNVELYSQLHSLQNNLNTLEENFKSSQDNIKTSTCNSQCATLNSKIEPNGVDDFLIQLLLSKPGSSNTVSEKAPLNSPLFINDDRASAPPQDKDE